MFKKFIDFSNSVFAFVIIIIIKIYQYFISPILTYLFGSMCRYTPTCSHYSIESFKNFVFPIALYLSIKRISRCHPFNEGGEDPLPEKVEFVFLNKKITFQSKRFQK